MRPMFLSLGMGVLFFSVAGLAAASEVEGSKLYGKWCSHCHNPGMPGTLMLAEKGRGENASIRRNNDLQPVYIETVVRKGLGMMPVFRKTEISDRELGVLIDYIVNRNKE